MANENNESEELTEDKLTEEEHKARAMLMGMEYYHGNGFPIYIAKRSDGSPDVGSMLDARTLKSIFDDNPDDRHRKNQAMRITLDMYERKRYGKGWGE